jgi:hypothetical protein
VKAEISASPAIAEIILSSPALIDEASLIVQTSAAVLTLSSLVCVLEQVEAACGLILSTPAYASLLAQTSPGQVGIEVDAQVEASVYAAASILLASLVSAQEIAQPTPATLVLYAQILDALLQAIIRPTAEISRGVSPAGIGRVMPGASVSPRRATEITQGKPSATIERRE